MPTIEVLPNSTTSSGANWTYSTLPPALAHTNALPTGSRGSRSTRNPQNFENSAARQRQINSRLAELERDNYRDVKIEVLKKGGGGGGGGGSRSSTRSKEKSTQNVRRILASQKTFSNHLADEEALRLTTTTTSTSTSTPHNSHHHHHRRHHRRESSSVSTDAMDIDNPPPSTTATTVAAAATTTAAAASTATRGVNETENGGLTLGYTAATAAPSLRPMRVFCEICGYWGKYRCGKCGARYCGLECAGVHGETRCNKFYA